MACTWKNSAFFHFTGQSQATSKHSMACSFMPLSKNSCLQVTCQVKCQMTPSVIRHWNIRAAAGCTGPGLQAMNKGFHQIPLAKQGVLQHINHWILHFHLIVSVRIPWIWQNSCLQRMMHQLNIEFISLQIFKLTTTPISLIYIFEQLSKQQQSQPCLSQDECRWHWAHTSGPHGDKRSQRSDEWSFLR